MAANDSTNRDAFGHWLSGFTDGEGCFTFQYYQAKSSYFVGAARFGIKLRKDDTEIIQRIQKFWGVGQVGFAKAKISQTTNRQDQVSYQIQKLADLVRVVIPHFERYPLQAKKKNDFAIWKQGVEFLWNIKNKPRKRYRHRGRSGGCEPQWSTSDHEKFQSLVALLKKQRQFNEAVIEIIPCICPKEKQRTLLT